MQKAVYALSLAYAILFGWAWYDTSTAPMDAAGRGMAFGFLTVGIMATAVLVIPAVILAAMGRGLKWALGLAIAPAALFFLAAFVGMI